MSSIPQPDVAQIEFVPVQTSSRLPHRVIPAIAGGLFAGLLLVGLGCTPLFQHKRSASSFESGTIVHARGETATVVDRSIVEGATSAKNSESAPAAHDSSGIPALAASSSKRGGVTPVASAADASPNAHSFSINCDPAHDGEGEADRISPRPESVALQGIMAGRTSKTALLDGVLYREGDHFGSPTCPWTVAMIEPSRVRIEKVFGDRTCGVTINWQGNNKAVAAKAR